MPLPDVPDHAIEFNAVAADWRAAVRLAGAALVRAGAATDAYTERMIAVVDEFGAYIVVAPGLALAHARPGPDVRRDGISVVTLAEPVAFGHAHNDPVSVVVGIASVSPDTHVSLVADIANVFNDPRAIPALRAATAAEEVRAILRG
ncbi:PTS sugar transporter subunit IIA [Gryllotalpicola protaetiae]|uniref:Ascorbate-specific PTS system EIIA component n=1 Tax=Gryllotalpicola protaetiae TaxID=2419771 RepID=A0A387C146_9MICO|nr:PTS sugar transporter subunit IIA [Gryllotalpicola protaetiae]AYG04251.1 PTS sugar transporter subunit IIA [Gryllotalpicola protaetiae]